MAHFHPDALTFHADARFTEEVEFDKAVTFHKNQVTEGDIFAQGDFTQTLGQLATIGDLLVEGKSTVHDILIKGRCEVQNGFEMLAVPMFKNGIRVENSNADVDKLYVRNTSVFRQHTLFDDNVVVKQDADVERHLTANEMTIHKDALFQSDVKVECNVEITKDLSIYGHVKLEGEENADTSARNPMNDEKQLQSLGGLESESFFTSDKKGFRSTNALWEDALCILENENGIPKIQTYSLALSPMRSATYAHLTALAYGNNGYIYVGYDNGDILKLDPYDMIGIKTKSYPELGTILQLAVDIHTNTLIVASQKMITLDAFTLELRSKNYLNLQSSVQDMAIYDNRLFVINSDDTLFSINFYRYDEMRERYFDIEVTRQFTFSTQTLSTLSVGTDGFLYIGYETEEKYYCGRFSRDFVSRDTFEAENPVLSIIGARNDYVYVLMTNGIVQQLHHDFSKGSRYETSDSLAHIKIGDDMFLYALGLSIHKINAYNMKLERPFVSIGQARSLLYLSVSPHVQNASSSWNTSYTWMNDQYTGMYHPQKGHISFASFQSPIVTMNPNSVSLFGDVDIYKHTNIMRELHVQERSMFSSNVLLFDGTEKEPAFSWLQDIDTGIYRPKNNELGWVTFAQERIRLNQHGYLGINEKAPSYLLDVNGQMRLTDQLYLYNGSESSPSLAFDDDKDLGIYRPSPQQMGIVVKGSEYIRIDDRGFLGVHTDNPRYHLHVNGFVRVTDQMLLDTGSAVNPAFSFEQDKNTGMYQKDADILAFATNSFYRGAFDNDGFDVDGIVRATDQYLAENGQANNPMYSFKTDKNTGIYLKDPDVLAFTTDGFYRGAFDTQGMDIDGTLRVSEQFLAEDGEQSKPIYSFKTDQDTGMYRKEGNILAFSTNKKYRGSFDTEGLDVDGTVRMTEQVLAEDGARNYPIYSFKNDKTSGMYLKEPHSLAFATSNIYRGGFDEDGFTVEGSFRPKNKFLGERGTATNPTYGFKDDGDTGIFLQNQDVLAFSTNGEYKGAFDNNGMDISGTVRASGQFSAEMGSQSTPIYSFKEDTQTGTYLRSQNDLAFATNGIHRGSFDESGLTVDINIHCKTQFLGEAGEDRMPIYTFHDDRDTGMYKKDDGIIGFSTQGDYRASLDTNGMDVQGTLRVSDQIRAESGREQNPMYSFKDDNDTGMFLDSVHVLAFSTDNTRRGAFDHAGFVVDKNIRADTQFLAKNGVNSRPVYSFQDENSSGMYCLNDSSVAFSVDGTYRGSFDPAGFDVNGTVRAMNQFQAMNGISTIPMYTFKQDNITGMYLKGQHVLAFSSRGEYRGAFDTDGLEVDGSVRSSAGFLAEFGGADDLVYSFRQDTDTGIYRKDPNVLAFATNAEYRGSFDTQGFDVNGILRATDQFLAPFGDAFKPIYSFKENSTSGMYLETDNQLAFSTNMSKRGVFSAYGLEVQGIIHASDVFLGEDGKSSGPTYSFKNDNVSGMYLDKQNTIAFSTNGTERMALDNNGLGVVGDTYTSRQFMASVSTFDSPAYSFKMDPSSGILLPTRGMIYFVTGGQYRALINQDGLDVDSTIHTSDIFSAERGSSDKPTYAFKSSVNTGMYLEDTNTIGLTTDGAKRVDIDSDGLHVTGNVFATQPYLAQYGDARDPIYSFEENPSSGMFMERTNTVAFSTAGTKRGYFDTDGFNVSGILKTHDQTQAHNGNSKNPAYSFQEDKQTGMYLKQGDVLGFAAGEDEIMNIHQNGIDVNGDIHMSSQILAENGAPSLPVYAFKNDDKTGMFLFDENVLGFSTAGSMIGSFDENGLHVLRDIRSSFQFISSIGNSENPGYAFIGDKHTGMFLKDENVIGFSTNKQTRMRLKDDGLTISGRLNVENQFEAENGAAENPTYTFGNDTDSGIYLRAQNNVGFTTGGTYRGSFYGDGLDVIGTITVSQEVIAQKNGDAKDPMFTFDKNKGTGLYLSQDNISLGLATNKDTRAVFHSAGMDVVGTSYVSSQYTGSNGNTIQPIYSFSEELSTGMYLDKGNGLAFSRSGQTKGYFDGNGLNVSGRIHASINFQSDIGSEDNPVYTFKADTKTGLYLVDENVLAVATDKKHRVSFLNEGVEIDGRLDVKEKIRMPNGTAGEPTYTFKEDTHSGMYLASANTLSFSVDQTNILDVDTSGIHITGSIYPSQQCLGWTGDVNNPSYSFAGDDDTGMYLKDLNVIGFATKDKHIVSINENGMEITGDLNLSEQFKAENGSHSKPSYTFDKNPNTGMYLPSQNVVAFAANGAQKGFFDGDGLEVIGDIRVTSEYQFLGGVRNSVSPTYSFENDDKTGMYMVEDDNNRLAFAVNEIHIAEFDRTGLDIDGNLRVFDQVRVQNGSTSTPHYSFEDEPGTGIYKQSQGTIGFSVSQTKRLLVDSNGIDVRGNIKSSMQILSDQGSERIPGISFDVDRNTGFYLKDLDNIGITAAGSNMVSMYASGVEVTGHVKVDDQILALNNGNPTNPRFSFQGDPSSGMYLESENHLAFSAGATQRMRLDSDGMRIFGTVYPSGQFLGAESDTDNPAYGFEGDKNTGMYLKDRHVLAFTTDGEYRGSFDRSGMDVSGNLHVNDQLCVKQGSEGVPHYAFVDDTNSGMYLESDNILGFSTNGTRRGRFTDETFFLYVDLKSTNKCMIDMGSEENPSYAFMGDADTGMYLDDLNTLAFSTSGGMRGYFNDDGLYVQGFFKPNGQILTTNGSKSGPTYSFDNDENTGMYLISTNNIGFAVNTQQMVNIDSDGLHVSSNITTQEQILGKQGSASSPSFSFFNDTNTGIYRKSLGNITFTSSGSECGEISDDGMIVQSDITSKGRMLVKNGKQGEPSMTFESDSKTGFYLDSTSVLAININESTVGDFSSTALTLQNNLNVKNQVIAKMGSQDSPSYTFEDHDETGIFLNKNGEDQLLTFSIADNTICEMITTGVNVMGNLYVNDNVVTSKGSSTSPSLTFKGKNNYGLYLDNNDAICVTINQTKKASIDENGISISGNITTDSVLYSDEGEASAPSYTFSGDDKTGFFLKGQGQLGITANEAEIAIFENIDNASNRLHVKGDINLYKAFTDDGSASGPSYSFDDDDNTGMYRKGADNIGFSTGGQERLAIGNNGLNVTGNLTVGDMHIKHSDTDGELSLYAFNNAKSTGMYLGDGNTLAFAYGGTGKGEFDEDGLKVDGKVRASDFVNDSDARKKKDVEEIRNALDKIHAMRGVHFRRIKDESQSIGFIAQELLPILPQVVTRDEKTSMYGVNYGVITALLIEGMKEMDENWKREMTHVHARLDSLEKKL